MTSNLMLDLTQVEWPESLLTCKNKIDGMHPGNEIDILAKDFDFVKNLIQVIEHSQCSIMKNELNQGCYQIRIKKM